MSSPREIPHFEEFAFLEDKKFHEKESIWTVIKRDFEIFKAEVYDWQVAKREQYARAKENFNKSWEENKVKFNKLKEEAKMKAQKFKEEATIRAQKLKEEAIKKKNSFEEKRKKRRKDPREAPEKAAWESDDPDLEGGEIGDDDGSPMHETRVSIDEENISKHSKDSKQKNYVKDERIFYSENSAPPSKDIGLSLIVTYVRD